MRNDESKIADESIRNAVEHQNLLWLEVIHRLRERIEPILFFGETELMTFQRLRKRKILEPEVSKGFRNDFQEAIEQVDQAYLDELLSTKPNECDRICDLNVPDEGITYEDIQKMSVRLNRGPRDFDMSVIT
ncbi:hypothetical protein PV327_008888 [Microctonus hyperodae]|uniref:Pre-mRNA processing factor 4 (PRP4)-like domain-containing protein n=1 Tax=Microctonus hyperodae TaxID=165561 RepID=A0AA39FT22_MICHY|nr:hypothetical protein PV327_008888 [Microctonus hyperodae]